jgi:hypothetical protein
LASKFFLHKAKKFLCAQRSIFSAGIEKWMCLVEIDPDGVRTVKGVVLGAITTLKPIREMIHSGCGHFLR